MGGLGNPDPRGFDNRGEVRCRKDFQGFSAQEIEPVAGAVNPERLSQFPRAGTKLLGIGGVPSPLHERNSAGGIEGANEDEAIFGAALDEEIQEPVDAVVQVNVCGARRVTGDEAARGRAGERVAGLVIPRGIRLGFDDDPAASPPEQLAADKRPGAREGIAREKAAVESRGAARMNPRSGVMFH